MGVSYHTLIDTPFAVVTTSTSHWERRELLLFSVISVSALCYTGQTDVYHDRVTDIAIDYRSACTVHTLLLRYTVPGLSDEYGLLSKGRRQQCKCTFTLYVLYSVSGDSKMNFLQWNEQHYTGIVKLYNHLWSWLYMVIRHECESKAVFTQATPL
jgi:hypothetical protein